MFVFFVIGILVGPTWGMEVDGPLFKRICQYQYANCTGDPIYEHIRLIGGCEDSLPHAGECTTLGVVHSCVADTSLAKMMPNWVGTRRGHLDRCGDSEEFIEVEGYVSGCFNIYHEKGVFLRSQKMMCVSGKQIFYTYGVKDCSGDLETSRMLGAETEFDKCAQTKKPYIWKTIHCEPEK